MLPPPLQEEEEEEVDDDECWIDVWLDRLRKKDHSTTTTRDEAPQPNNPLSSSRRPWVWVGVVIAGVGVTVQVIASWMVAGAVLALYAYQYAKITCDVCSIRPPLMTEAKGSIVGTTETVLETYNQLVAALHMAGCCEPLKKLDTEHSTTTPFALNDHSQYSSRLLLTQVIRRHSTLRRLVSRFMQAEDEARNMDADLFETLDAVYDALLSLPNDEIMEEQDLEYEISVVVPCYDREPVEVIRRCLDALYRNCHDPNRVQLVLVHALDLHPQDEVSHDDNAAIMRRMASSPASPAQQKQPPQPPQPQPPQRLQLEPLVQSMQSLSLHNSSLLWFADTQVVVYREGGGRGPALNCGAQCSQGRLVMFVHCDCIVPRHWDVQIQSTLLTGPPGRRRRRRRNSSVSATAFLLGIDWGGRSPQPPLLRSWWYSQYPWGIRAVQVMVAIRTCLLHMPYGDQAIAMRSSDFHYIGGFPNQPIMEDYELMHFLRQRRAWYSCRRRRRRCCNDDDDDDDGAVSGLFRPCLSTCGCSPRRWQKVGVLYMTLSNALVVHRYATDPRWTPARVFDYYYHNKNHRRRRTNRQRRPSERSNNNNNNNRKHMD